MTEFNKVSLSHEIERCQIKEEQAEDRDMGNEGKRMKCRVKPGRLKKEKCVEQRVKKKQSEIQREKR